MITFNRLVLVVLVGIGLYIAYRVTPDDSPQHPRPAASPPAAAPAPPTTSPATESASAAPTSTQPVSPSSDRATPSTQEAPATTTAAAPAPTSPPLQYLAASACGLPPASASEAAARFGGNAAWWQATPSHQAWSFNSAGAEQLRFLVVDAPAYVPGAPYVCTTDFGDQQQLRVGSQILVNHLTITWFRSGNS